MFRAFNMGVGMIVATDEQGADAVCASAATCDIVAWQIGTLVTGNGRVILNSGGMK